MQTRGEPHREFNVAATIIKLPMKASWIKKKALFSFFFLSLSLSRSGKKNKISEATKMRGVKRSFTIFAFSHQLKNKSGRKRAGE